MKPCGPYRDRRRDRLPGGGPWHPHRERRRSVPRRGIAPRRGGRPFVERFGNLFRIRPDHIARAEVFFARHGDKAILAARFILGLRTWGSMLAGMAHMPFWRFQIFSAIGGLAWAVIVGIAGYLLGSNLALIGAVIRDIGIGGVVVLVLVVVIAVLARMRAARP